MNFHPEYFQVARLLLFKKLFERSAIMYSVLFNIGLLVVGFFLLTKGADLFVDNASGIAKKIGISSLVIGLTIVAFGTSMPELAVSVTAALEGANEIAVGNVVGSNIFNLLIVAGMSAIITPLYVDKDLMRRDWPISTLAALLLFMMLLNQQISQIEAILLLLCFGMILFFQLKSAKQEGENNETETKSVFLLIIFLIIGILGIVIGGEMTVEGAKALARSLGWSESFIGLTIIACGTSLPELVTSVVAARKGENEIAMGNVIGSNIFNILLILGVSSFLHPIHVAMTAMIDTLVLLVVSSIYWFICKKYTFNKKVGISMVLVYLVYLVYLINR